MALSLEEVRKQATERSKRRTIALAMLHQNRLKFHTATVPNTPALQTWTMKGMRKADADPILLGRAGVSQALWDFLAMVQNIIPHDKYKTFCSLFRFPVHTNEILGIAYDKLSRIFEGRNPSFVYQFTATEQRDDWEWYRQEVLREPEVWKTRGWDYFKTRINSVLVCDLPAVQEAKDRYPRPYFYWLKIDDVIAYETEDDNAQMRWIIFRQDEDIVAVLDDMSYRLFTSKDGSVGDLISEQPHDLGYCPARFFWSEPINLEEPDVKMSPVSKVLDALDWYLFYSISKRYLDTYGSYPIYWGYEQNCDYSNSENGDYCDGGYLKDKQGRWLYDQNGLMVPCPLCHDKRITGAGSFLEIPVPQENQPDLRNPVGMLSVDRNSLDYTTEEAARLREDIITAIVGQNEQITAREAVNEQQVKANFESQSTVLNRVKKGFEAAQAWVDMTCCKLRYGSSFLSLSISYGTEFYLFSSDELRERYKTAKESGASEGELDALAQQIIETEYRNNPQQMQRMIILMDLEPYHHLTRNEVQGLYEKQIIPMEEYIVKLNFADFIRRFERENMNILEFGENIDYDNKIDTIKERLMDYAREVMGEQKKEPIIKEE